MKTMKTVLAVAALLVSTSAFASQCPVDMKKIDAAMAGDPSLSASQMTSVKELRASGEANHKAGKHKESVDDLAKAKKILGIM
jgi:hypothetical protein